MNVLLLLLLTAHPTKVALMPLNNGENVTSGVAEAVTDAVAAEVRKHGIGLITQKDMVAVMGLEKEKALLGCANDHCMAELGGALGVDLLLTGSISKLGESYLIHLQVVDPVKVLTRAQSDRRKKGGSIDDVLDQLPGMVDELFGAAAPGAAPVAPVPVGTAAVVPTPGSSGSVNRAPPAWADLPADLGADATKLVLLTDGHGHYLATVPFGGSEPPLLAGDAQHLYLQRVFGRSSMGTTQFTMNFWEPRARAPADAELVFRDQAYHLFCGKEDVTFTAVPEAEAKKILSQAKRLAPRWQRHGLAIARDDTGTYFYVDQAREPEDSHDFRLFVGKKGSLSYLPVISADRDSDADLFTTAQGTLKLPRGTTNSETPLPAEWIANDGTERSLSHLDVVSSARMIYTELGVYARESLGTPCDGHF